MIATLIAQVDRARGRSDRRGPGARQRDPRRAVLLLHRRTHVADPRGLHDVRDRRRAPQERDGDGDEEHPHDRRRHADVLLLRLVDLQLQPARPADRPELERLHVRGLSAAASRGPTPSGPNLTNNINLVFFLAFLLFSWTTASIMSGALIERVAALGLPGPRGASSARSSGSWTPPGAGAPAAGSRCASASTTRSPRGWCTAWRARSRSACCSTSGRESASTRRRAWPDSFRPHNMHMTLLGLMLIFTGFYGFYAACLVIASTSFPGWANIYLSPTTLGSIAMVITIGFAGGFTGRLLRQQGRPVLDGLRRPRRRDQRVRRRGRVRPDARLPARHGQRGARGLRGQLDREEACASTTPSARSRSTASAGFLGSLWVGVFAGRLPDRREQRGQLDRRPADRHGRPSCRSASSPATRAAWVLKKLNILRVPPEVELRASTWPSTSPTCTYRRWLWQPSISSNRTAPP